MGAGDIRDLRDWLQTVAGWGQLARITRPVSLDEELAAIVYLVAKGQGAAAPAILFEQVRGHPGYAVLANIMGASLDRLALSLGLPAGLSAVGLVAALRDRVKRTIAPEPVSPAGAPIDEVVWEGAAVDLTRLPAPKFWPRDGGNYLGTADICITRHPDGEQCNLGTYRLMLHGPRELGFYVSPGKDALLHREAWWRRNQACPVAVVLGADPVLLAVAGWSFPRQRSEYEYAGGLRGAPLEVVRTLDGNLWVPARAEVVLEGVTRPGVVKPEGPFGEFTGYYGRPTADTPVIEVERVRMRRHPILTAALMAEYPACEHAGLVSVMKAARIWDDLDALGVPGIRAVACHPAAAAGFGMTVVSLEQRYPGHVAQVLALAAQVPSGAYYTKWIVAVDEDVDPGDLHQVLWALSTRCHPAQDLDLLHNTWSTPLDPSQPAPEKRPFGSKVLINACRPFGQPFSPRTRLRRAVYEAVRARWQELGLGGQPPVVGDFEPEAAAPKEGW